MKNREVFLKDPTSLTLPNQGVAKVADVEDARQLQTLRFELETFVCEGRYEQGLEQILNAYLKNLDQPEQPGVWVSGFYGSGKSHLVKILRYLWVDHHFESDGATARGLARLPTAVQDHLKELSTQGKRHSLHAASGTLKTGVNPRLGLLEVVFLSAGLPREYFKARFVMWLRSKGWEKSVEDFIQARGSTLAKEMQDLYVSDLLGEALLSVSPSLGANVAEVHTLLAKEYPKVNDITPDDMVDGIRRALTRNGRLPCTLIVLDEIQQHIGEGTDAASRTWAIQEIAEACSSRFDGKLMLVGTGQSALSRVSHLQRLLGRFTVRVDLLDEDVEAVTRKMVLAKRPDRTQEVQDRLNASKGEIARHLAGTQIGPRSEDTGVLVIDYPLLPVRRRFWEKALRGIDPVGTTAQLRSMLQIVLEAVQGTADRPVGHVIPADALFWQKASDMRQTGMLSQDIEEIIYRQKSVPDQGELRARLAALAFLISKLSREEGADLGVRANADTLGDLLVEVLPAGSTYLRSVIPELLARMSQDGTLMKVGDEYRLQTRESSAWNEDFQQRYNRVINDASRLGSLISDLLTAECQEQLASVKKFIPNTSKSKESRKLELCFTDDALKHSEAAIPVRVYNGWVDDDKEVGIEVLKAKPDSPVVYLFLPKTADAELKKALAGRTAARDTLDARGTPSTDTGREAQTAIETRRKAAESELRSAVTRIFAGAQVYQAGVKTDLSGGALVDRVRKAADTALTRLYPQFDQGDDPEWDTVIEWSRKGDGAPLKPIGHEGNTESHPVCVRVRNFVASGKKGSEIRDHFTGPPFGWPRDTVDGALLALCSSGHLRCAHQGKAVEVKAVEKARIGHYDFRQETATISTGQKMVVRGLLQAVGVKFEANKESAAVAEYLKTMEGLAAAAGGEAPLPTLPETTHLDEIGGQGGNEQLLALYERRERLKGEAEAWATAGQTIKERLPRWSVLLRLLEHAAGLDVSEEVRPQAEAIKAKRGLLETPDPVPPLCDRLTQSLRTALVKAHGDFRDTYQGQLLALGGADAWQQLSADDRDQILRQQGLDVVPEIQTGTEAQILASLDARSLADWATLRDALPQRFQKALVETTRRSQPSAEPVAQSYTLPHATFRTEEEFDAWVAEVRQEVLKRLEQGPVIV
jgi:hypothetical protein